MLVERFLGLEATSRLSRAALETLAIIAYQQPITRPYIDGVRGVNSAASLSTSPSSPVRPRPSTRTASRRRGSGASATAGAIRRRKSGQSSIIGAALVAMAISLDGSFPFLGMGDKENPVNIWFWRAGWQQESDGPGHLRCGSEPPERHVRDHLLAPILGERLRHVGHAFRKGQSQWVRTRSRMAAR